MVTGYKKSNMGYFGVKRRVFLGNLDFQEASTLGALVQSPVFEYRHRRAFRWATVDDRNPA